MNITCEAASFLAAIALALLTGVKLVSPFLEQGQGPAALLGAQKGGFWGSDLRILSSLCGPEEVPHFTGPGGGELEH